MTPESREAEPEEEKEENGQGSAEGQSAEGGAGAPLPDILVRRVEGDTDADRFVELQDQFAVGHRELAKGVYENVCLRDWQLCLCCPREILDMPRGRQGQFAQMSAGEDPYGNLTILKALTRPEDGEAEGKMIGYIMYSVHDASAPRSSSHHHHQEANGAKPGPGRRRKRGRPQALEAAEAGQPWAQVKQLFVDEEYRRHGTGKLLMNSMLEAVESEKIHDIRLQVLDLNTKAMEWYRSLGFVIVEFAREFLGERDEANIIVYQEMWWRGIAGTRLGVPPAADVVPPTMGWNMLLPPLFRAEVIHEVITIDYPENAGIFDVRITGYDEESRFHKVASSGLSLWDGDEFDDEIDLNTFYRAGFVKFQRNLCTIHRDRTVKKRSVRKAKAEQRAGVLRAKLDQEKALLEDAMSASGPLTRQQRKQQQQQPKEDPSPIKQQLPRRRKQRRTASMPTLVGSSESDSEEFGGSSESSSDANAGPAPILRRLRPRRAAPASIARGRGAGRR